MPSTTRDGWDDLTFSGSERILNFRGLLQRIIEDEGFIVKTDKTRTEFAKDRQTVTNFVVNTKVNLPKEKRSAIRQEVITAHNTGQPLSPSTAGKMFWLRSVNPGTGERLIKRVLGISRPKVSSEHSETPRITAPGKTIHYYIKPLILKVLYEHRAPVQPYT